MRTEHIRPQIGVLSRAVHADGEFTEEFGVAPSIDMATTYTRPGQSSFHEMARLPRPMKFYGRYGNPTVARTGALVADLQGAEAALMTSSGMAAISTVLFALLKAGDHVVVGQTTYGETLDLLTEFERFGVSATRLPSMNADAVSAALRPHTRLVYLETPSNPLLQITDLDAVSAVCRAAGVLTVADNTLASMVNSRPLEHGVDLVVESGTKYMGGHSDLIAGVIAGSLEHLEQIWWPQVLAGCTLSPHDAWLLQRGIRTMPMRVRQQNRTALAVAEAAMDHPAVARVLYPGLAGHPGHEVAARQMDGFGGMLSIELRGGFEAAARFVAALDLLTYAASLGDVHTLVMHPAAGWMGGSYVPPEAAHVPQGLIRISVGIEDTADVVAEVLRALSSAEER
ncbi:trans-sulfuration enzyme family protein [Streptomyces sp. NPDC001617]